MAVDIAPRPDAITEDLTVGERALGYEPSLDGIRAIAVLAVLCFHNGFGWATGGFLGVSTFFTLSGFLITTLMLTEHSRRGRVRLGEFWSRRFRRLMPASLLTLGGIVVFAATVATADQLRALRGDIFATLAYVANWRFIAVDRSYAELFSAPSPVQHFWSLAIEEQFYIAFPLLVVGVLVASRGSRVALAIVLAALTIASVAISWLLFEPGGDNLRIYYGTETRAAELLLGALLGIAMLGRARLRRAGPRRAVAMLGIVALVITLWTWRTAAIGDEWLYRGGFGLYALASAALVAGALQPGVLRRVLSTRLLVSIGLVSYGVYLIHWPVFLWLTEGRTGLGPWPLFVLRLAVTLPLAFASARFVEQPVRLRRMLQGWRGPLAAVLAAALVIAGTVVVTRDPPDRAVTLDVAGATVTRAPTRVTVVGDSLGASVVPALADWQNGDVTVHDLTLAGCPLVRATVAELTYGSWVTPDPACDARAETWSETIGAFRPDVIVVFTGLGEIAERALSVDDVARSPGDPELDRWLVAELGLAADTLVATGAPVVWLTLPELSIDGQLLVDPARVDHFNRLLDEVASERDGLTVLDVGDEIEEASVFGLDRANSDSLVDWLGPHLGEVVDSSRDTVQATERSDPLGDAEIGPGPETLPMTLQPGETPRVLVVGDSFAFSLGLGLQQWSATTGTMDVSIHGGFGCPLARGGRYRFLRVDSPIDEEECDWGVIFPRMVAQTNPHTVVLATGVWETADRLLPGETRWRGIGDPVFDRYLERELVSAIDTLGARGARVMLVMHPYVHAGRDLGMPDTLPESDPARMDALNEILRRVAARRPEFVHVLELQTWFREQPGGELDPAMRGDGVHISDEFGATVGAWVGPQLGAIIPRS